VILFRTLADLASRAGISLRAGKTFGGKRDLYTALGYQPTLICTDYRARYARGGIAARVVDAFPKATWRGGAELIEDEDPEVLTAFEEEWNNLSTSLQIWPLLSRTDILAGIGRYAGLLLGVPGDLGAPATTGPLAFLAPYSEDELTVEKLEEDVASPRFGLPLLYKLSRKSIVTSGSISKLIHWSRIIHVADNILDDPVYGAARMERVWNYLDDLDKVTGGGSEAYWRRVHMGYFFNVDPTTEITDAQITAMKEQAENFAHGMQRTLAMRGAEIEALSSEVANFSNQVASIVSLISGATEIPQRILLGSERGELASTQDKENWDTRVSDRRRDFAEPVVRTLVARLQDLNVLSAAKFEIRWPVIAEMNPEQQASVAEKLAGLNDKIGDTVITAAEIRDHILGLEKLDEEEKDPGVPVVKPPTGEEEEEETPPAERQRTAESPKAPNAAGRPYERWRIVRGRGSRG
jgi:hypothetical protein